MTKAEQETTITYDNEERLVRIFSARASDQGKLRRAGMTPERGTLKTGFFYSVALSRLSWRVRKPAGPLRKVLPSSHPFLRAKTTKVGISGA